MFYKDAVDMNRKRTVSNVVIKDLSDLKIYASQYNSIIQNVAMKLNVYIVDYMEVLERMLFNISANKFIGLDSRDDIYYIDVFTDSILSGWEVSILDDCDYNSEEIIKFGRDIDAMLERGINNIRGSDYKSIVVLDELFKLGRNIDSPLLGAFVVFKEGIVYE